MLRALLRTAMLPVGLVVTIGLAAPAFADCHGDGVNSGSTQTYVGVGIQRWEWSLANRRAYTRSESQPAMSYDLCLDAIFDWETQSNHYDSRVTRMCAKGRAHGGTVTEPAGWGGRTVTGLQKAAGCKYLQTSPPAASPPDYAACDHDPDSETGCPITANAANAWNTLDHAVFLMRQDGQVEINPGGAVSDPDN